MWGEMECISFKHQNLNLEPSQPPKMHLCGNWSFRGRLELLQNEVSMHETILGYETNRTHQ